MNFLLWCPVAVSPFGSSRTGPRALHSPWLLNYPSCNLDRHNQETSSSGTVICCLLLCNTWLIFGHANQSRYSLQRDSALGLIVQGINGGFSPCMEQSYVYYRYRAQLSTVRSSLLMYIHSYQLREEICCFHDIPLHYRDRLQCDSQSAAWSKCVE